VVIKTLIFKVFVNTYCGNTNNKCLRSANSKSVGNGIGVSEGDRFIKGIRNTNFDSI